MKTIRTRPVQGNNRYSRTIDAGQGNAGQGTGQRRGGGLSLSKIMVYAPIALEVINLIRQNQKQKQGKFYKARKREKAFDFILDQANRRMGGKSQQKRGWF